MMPNQTIDLSFLEVCTGKNPFASVIWLHGLGADGHDFEPVVDQLGLPLEVAARFIFPHATIQSVTLNGGMKMPAWYDLYGLSLDSREDEHGIRASAAAIDQLIAHEKSRGIKSSQIILAGFSQGGAIALHAGLRQEQPLAGIMALSTYLPLRQYVSTECDINQPPGSIFIAHGTQDAVLDCEMGRQTNRLLMQHGYNPEWHEYAMGHSVCSEEIRDIRDWLLRVLKAI